MILSAQQIEEAYRAGDILINPFDVKQIQAASYDLRLGHQAITTTTKELIDMPKKGYVLLQPGDFGIVLSLEEVRLGPQYAARFGLRSKFARAGIIASTGPQIDPGYHGRLIVGVSNLSPRALSLPYGEDFLTVEFHRLEEPTTKPYIGPYQGKLELGPEEIRAIVEAESMALPEVLKTLRGLSENVGEVTGRIDTLTSHFDAVAARLTSVETMHSKALIRQNQILIAFALGVLGLLARVIFR
jgi:dCTP deaminase